jgi:hypothetical protein
MLAKGGGIRVSKQNGDAFSMQEVETIHAIYMDLATQLNFDEEAEVYFVELENVYQHAEIIFNAPQSDNPSSRLNGDTTLEFLLAFSEELREMLSEDYQVELILSTE